MSRPLGLREKRRPSCSPSKAYGEPREALAPLHGTARVLAAGCDARRARISSRCSSGLQQRSRHTAAPKLWIDQKLCCKRQCRLRRRCHEKRTKEGERRRRRAIQAALANQRKQEKMAITHSKREAFLAASCDAVVDHRQLLCRGQAASSACMLADTKISLSLFIESPWTAHRCCGAGCRKRNLESAGDGVRRRIQNNKIEKCKNLGLFCGHRHVADACRGHGEHLCILPRQKTHKQQVQRRRQR